MKKIIRLFVRLNTARLFKSGLTLAALICLSGVKSTYAIPITYTFSGIGIGSLGASTFSGSSFTITCTADTSQINTTIYRVPVLVATVFVSGLGTATFTTPTFVGMSRPNGRIIFQNSSFGDIFDEFNYPVFSVYNLATAIGPITGQADGSVNPVATTAGQFSLGKISSAAFQASVPDRSSTLVLLGLGMAAIGCSLWATKRHSKSQLAEVRTMPPKTSKT